MKRLLCIHSAVSVGFVGNSVAAPVLTALGHHPCLVDTVTLAAHPGYGRRTGASLPRETLADILAGLDEFGEMARMDAVITGYFGDEGQIDEVAAHIARWQDARAGLYLLDPVMGDAGRLYVDTGLVTAITEKLLPLATCVTPNGYELSLLSGLRVDDLESATLAAETLLERHSLRAVVATGIPWGVGGEEGTGVGDLLVWRDGRTDWRTVHSEARNLAGGGDLLAALLAGHLVGGMEIDKAFDKASRTAQRVISASPGERDLALLENLEMVRAG